jgi:uncharacterized protein
MQFKVKDIGEAGVDVDLKLPPAWLAEHCQSADLELTADESGQPLAFKGRIERTGDDYLLRGKLKGDLRVPCARCLEPASLLLDVDASVIYVERDADDADGPDGEAVDEDALDAPDVLGFQDGVIDLGPELRDEILLAVPVRVLCDEECLGLCAVCGGNRNTNPCDCAERERQSQGKFAGLSKLKI